ncbi:MAG: 6,7-dimethyl-8-ribityllumazine synthase [Sediminibacterium sp. Gen4]|jgi:6,7-dimethyl-8-ribityllumazine synthase|uniref:6,7-dimethyl-8-ribityllumazine synthase n=1 Tax=unclassified Sediminibacterium TaxID=2635961 RepID=UPI0015BF2746|nr:MULTISPECIES: 6,7-dimethyl-8-ribityllumazine synthase [unclassified Sediminibacterium]MBW0160450.1 6,7-dimethyl-8-ribityllumazine synthase [Sediminibacterium sp.]MBW0162887.1 6,7-dimethyl-8-ribityllumazine synthase [Sediminibacterium sp.]NWK67370.1 6,7-dimethyl-8-ribityllumazine synthase [Sediminibacterium sp. Gen4]
MATKGNTSLNKGIPVIKDAFVVIVKTEWNAHIINKLEAGAKKVLKEQGVSCKTLVVPGAFEIPFAVKNHYAYSPQPPDAYITLGTIIRGDTPHFDYVCKAVTDGVVQLNLTLDVPVVFGVLTVDNETQAIERIGGAHGHKGEEAAITAIKMMALNRKLRNQK